MQTNIFLMLPTHNILFLGEDCSAAMKMKKPHQKKPWRYGCWLTIKKWLSKRAWLLSLSCDRTHFFYYNHCASTRALYFDTKCFTPLLNTIFFCSSAVWFVEDVPEYLLYWTWHPHTTHSYQNVKVVLLLMLFFCVLRWI